MRSVVISALMSLLAMALLVTSAPGGEVVIQKGLTYGQGGKTKLQLDLARPKDKDAGPYPALIFVHNGGWHGGSRDSYDRYIEIAAERGYVAVTVDYRLTAVDQDAEVRNEYPAALHDVKCAVRWLRANAEKYAIDSERIGVMGESTGAHLALLLALTGDEPRFEGEGGHAEFSSRVQAAVNFHGPCDLLSLHASSPPFRPSIESFVGGSPGEAPLKYLDASPDNFINRGDPPVLTMHGSLDNVVPIDQPRVLDRKMQQAGVPHLLLEINGQGHGFRFDVRKRSMNVMFNYFDRLFKPEQFQRARQQRSPNGLARP